VCVCDGVCCVCDCLFVCYLLGFVYSKRGEREENLYLVETCVVVLLLVEVDFMILRSITGR